MMNDAHKARVRSWIEATVSDGGIERMDELHIDAIDEHWKEQSTWISSALGAYRSALQIRDELRLPVKVALAFSLSSGTGDSFETIEQFEQEVDWSPPSLYLFALNHTFYRDTAVRKHPLPDEMTADLPVGTESFLLRWTTDQGEDRRSVVIEG